MPFKFTDLAAIPRAPAVTGSYNISGLTSMANRIAANNRFSAQLAQQKAEADRRAQQWNRAQTERERATGFQEGMQGKRFSAEQDLIEYNKRIAGQKRATEAYQQLQQLGDAEAFDRVPEAASRMEQEGWNVFYQGQDGRFYDLQGEPFGEYGRTAKTATEGGNQPSTSVGSEPAAVQSSTPAATAEPTTQDGEPQAPTGLEEAEAVADEIASKPAAVMPGQAARELAKQATAIQEETGASVSISMPVPEQETESKAAAPLPADLDPRRDMELVAYNPKTGQVQTIFSAAERQARDQARFDTHVAQGAADMVDSGMKEDWIEAAKVVRGMGLRPQQAARAHAEQFNAFQKQRAANERARISAAARPAGYSQGARVRASAFDTGRREAMRSRTSIGGLRNVMGQAKTVIDMLSDPNVNRSQVETAATMIRKLGLDSGNIARSESLATKGADSIVAWAEDMAERLKANPGVSPTIVKQMRATAEDLIGTTASIMAGLYDAQKAAMMSGYTDREEGDAWAKGFRNGATELWRGIELRGTPIFRQEDWRLGFQPVPGAKDAGGAPVTVDEALEDFQ